VPLKTATSNLPTVRQDFEELIPGLSWEKQRKDKRTRIAFRVALWLLVAGFALPLAAQFIS